MRIRRAQNNINEMENEEGNLVTDQQQIADALVKHFQKKFEETTVKFDEDLFAAIPKILNEEDNLILDAIPSSIETKKAILEMNDSAPGPDSFPGSFYKFAWETIGTELVEAILYCWRNNFIPKGFNSKFLFLLPKIQGAKKAEHFRPIGLANFNFKVIKRIITTRVSTMIDEMVSVQQSAFIKGRNIQEKIVLASELVDELDIKRRGGNVGLKIDIAQTFDSISWNFLFELEEGSGDPLSPILFVLAEEVLSRNISKLVQTGKLQAMVNRGGFQPTHLMFADDIFIFCNGHKKNLQNLMDWVNIKKHQDKYLGVILNPGRVKTYQVWGMVKMMQKMLAGWMGKLLAFSVRLTLVKFVQSSMPIYSMSVYKWPKSVILIVERIIRNFLWSGDPDVEKLVTVKWGQLNAPIEEGEIGFKKTRNDEQSNANEPSMEN
ncbi:uncharacterized protein LOC113296035 [Papaver somniferum]|uniref:uncharacterized protein LOC113296035 n=1 Tax=Papaver somniferum TaxID=3469 RepID=UPI000E6F83A1|nr:uncharacterized protein LOC113296035 [Papaver somniferum]